MVDRRDEGLFKRIVRLRYITPNGKLITQRTKNMLTDENKNCIKNNTYYFRGKLQKVEGIKIIKVTRIGNDIKYSDETIIQFLVYVPLEYSKKSCWELETHIYNSLKKDNALIGLGDIHVRVRDFIL